jgi:RNA polymerase sigma-70 factor (ECF subfamily)
MALVLHDVEALVAEHRGWLLRLCERRLGGDRHLAEDVVQETFVKLSRALDRGDDITNVRGWLRTVAQNGTVDELRRSRSILVDELPDAATHDTFAADGDPELEVAWQGLNPRHREVLRLRELEGLRYDEIATAMATGVPAIETLLFRARAALRREYTRASAAVVSAPAQVAVGPLRPSRWASLWRSSGVAARTAEAKLVSFVERVQLALAATTDHVAEVAGGLVVGGVAVASLLSPTVPDLPPVVPPAVSAPEVPTTVPPLPPTPAPEVPAAPAVPPTAAPEPDLPAPPPIVTETIEPAVDTVVDEVVDVLGPVLHLLER